MAIETLEGDFIIRTMSSELIRFHFTDDSLVITKRDGHVQHVVVCTISEAIELGVWLDKNINEPR